MKLSTYQYVTQRNFARMRLQSKITHRNTYAPDAETGQNLARALPRRHGPVLLEVRPVQKYAKCRNNLEIQQAEQEGTPDPDQRTISF